VDAFIALGGRSDKGGEISTDKLRAVIKDFGLTIDIDVSAAVACPTAHRPTADACSLTPTPDPVAASQRLIRETDTDHSGLIDYEEFKQMMVDKKR
jgi:calmodulin|tara:strand:- start:500 stop:787 length:288 start_codon:yes stop_codon:yes gene_type:complete